VASVLQQLRGNLGRGCRPRPRLRPHASPGARAAVAAPGTARGGEAGLCRTPAARLHTARTLPGLTPSTARAQLRRRAGDRDGGAAARAARAPRDRRRRSRARARGPRARARSARVRAAHGNALAPGGGSLPAPGTRAALAAAAAPARGVLLPSRVQPDPNTPPPPPHPRYGAGLRALVRGRAHARRAAGGRRRAGCLVQDRALRAGHLRCAHQRDSEADPTPLVFCARSCLARPARPFTKPKQLFASLLRPEAHLRCAMPAR
jgi:hypothetical protein